MKEDLIAKTDDKVLEKLERKIKLDTVFGNLIQKLGPNEGPLDWIRLIHSIDDTKLQKILGTDVALYLVLLRYCG